VTRILREVAAGERRDMDALLVAVYDDLRVLANRHLRQERSDHTLQATALVHEVYLRLVNQEAVEWRDRVHFFAVASHVIRRILVDHARKKKSAKRGGERQKLTLNEVAVLMERGDVDLVALDDALAALGQIDAQRSRLVEMRFFGGLSVDECAEALGVSPRTAKRIWVGAKAWLYRELAGVTRAEG
jgi:RNA polymerase sigma factor (TIGR02999 family)